MTFAEVVMGVRSWFLDRSSSLQSRRLFMLGALLFVGGCVASFQACSAHEDDPVGSSSQTQALQTTNESIAANPKLHP